MRSVSGVIRSIEITIVLAIEVFPAISVAVIERVWTPSGSGLVGVSEYDPEALTVAVARIVPDPSFIVIVSPGVPEPVMVGVASAVANGEVLSHPRVPGVVGVMGGVVSIVRVRGVELTVQLVGTRGSH